MLATELTEKGKEIQAATLQRVMGNECCHVYKHNLGLSEEQVKDPTTILDALVGHFKPTRNVIFERYIFGNCKQDKGEPIDAFITQLREKAASCEYGELKEDLIRDRLVLGVCDETVCRRLLREKKLTLTSAIEICQAAEMTDMSLKAMTHDRPPETVMQQTAIGHCLHPGRLAMTSLRNRRQAQTKAQYADFVATCTGMDVNFALHMVRTAAIVEQ